MKRATTRQAGRDGLPALALIEEAVHLLRRAPAGVWLCHFFGAGAWVLAVLFAWAYASWFRPGRDEIALGACGLAVVYAWLKTAQAEMCGRLMALRLGAAPERFTWRRALRLAGSQFAPHAFGPAALLVAGALAVPFLRTWAFFQTITVLGAPEKTRAGNGDAMALAKLWPGQMLGALLIFTLLTAVVFANVAAAFYMLPWLGRALLGMENFMSMSGWSMLNTTFLTSVCALTWFAVDPLMKAFCVLRVFHGRALRTGADLHIEMDNAGVTRRRTGAVTAALLLFACALFFTGGRSHATPPPGQPTPPAQEAEASRSPALQPDKLNRAIDEVLERRDFRWQLQPEKKAKTAAGEEPGAITRFFNWLGRGLRSVAEGIASFVDWLHDLISAKNRKATGDGPPAVKTDKAGGDAWLLKILLYGLIAILAGLLAWVIAGMFRKRAPDDDVQAAAADAPEEAKPDLADENAHAAQLPGDEWLRLAHEQAARGEWRLALRALYLAHLARLGDEGLITLRRHKTNLDYERELRRRALRRMELAAWFAKRRREYEASWYGREQPGEERVREWFAEVEKGAAGLLS